MLVIIVLISDKNCGEVNIAQNKQTSESSLFENRDSSLVVDGSLRTEFHFCSHTQNNANEWLAIDLERVTNICKVMLLNRNEVGEY